jgi:hypothetical protein
VKNHPEEANGAAAGPADDAAKRYARLSALVARKCEVRAKLDREIDDLNTQLRGLVHEFPGLSNPKD